ncbi:hypothetical protein [Nocardia asteroides]|uniref:hypothetical protein n=1 Tax=Nocardia asteroides TaxID=1824 RepID=UPI003401E699
MPRTVLPLPYERPPLSLNDSGRTRGAAIARAKVKREIRSNVVAAATLAGLPKDVAHVTVTLHWRPAVRRTRDTDNPVATLKPACDALTPARAARLSPKGRTVPALIGYGMVADDDPAHMTKREPVIHEPLTGQPGAVWLELEWAA